MIRNIYSDRSRAQLYRRCPRARWHEYESGPAGQGIVPVRKNIHLCLGLAFHAGAEILLRRSMDRPEEIIGCLDSENNAVQAALLELEKWTAAGVEVDLQEQPEKRNDGTNTTFTDGAADSSLAGNASTRGLGRVQDQQTRAQADSPIVIDFGGAEDYLGGALIVPAEPSYQGLARNFADPIYDISPAPSPAPSPTAGSLLTSDESRLLAEIEIHDQANEAAATGVDDYLRRELVALVEAMVRAYARRRLRPLLEEFEVLEVEREGTWKLGDIPGKHDWETISNTHSTVCRKCHALGGECSSVCPFDSELHWMSRHDGLLLERSTSSLYLLSYKTTGAWDRRKKADAEIDMQGLSEAVDVEKRLGEAWELLRESEMLRETLDHASDTRLTIRQEQIILRINSLVSSRIIEWLCSQPAPPKILGVRYEYILKGARREDKKFGASEGSRRWVQDSPLIRAYKSEGITAEDRRWAPKYEWSDITGKERRIDYRSWKKSAVWESMPIAAWIDLLDRGEYWPGKGEDFDAAGNAVDVLGDQFVPPVVVYRNEDDLRDLLEQLEAQEVGVALAVEEVKRAEKEGEGAKRSALNRLFPQNRSACCFPSICVFQNVCYGGEDIRRNPLNSGLYTIRQANHPIEGNLSLPSSQY